MPFAKWFSAFFSRQARNPSGIFGRFFMLGVFDKGNVEQNALTLRALDVCDGERCLEIGYGPGGLLRQIADSTSSCQLEGVDLSKSMASAARRRNKTHIRSGRMRLDVGDFDALPFEEDAYDKIFTVNTVYFWKTPEDTAAKIHRLLKPGGKAVIGFVDGADMEAMPLDTDVFSYYTPQDMSGMLSAAAPWNAVDIVSLKGRNKTSHCAVAVK